MADPPDIDLVAIPGLGAGEIPVVESLLAAAGFWFLSSRGDWESTPPQVFIRAADREAVQEYLKEFSVRGFTGSPGPIPW
jgi:hypothetical protein